eukprot:TRINITY_DN22529_c0_g1_i1.p1 TRINITY_DN22529_c0_g1~~TRINITY_DN22529_c0_g1_i1.p1  ORF type:complete len:218 (-),score=43.14 TRINITY_DN22529_c0_g1_i1:343-996(-)
MVDARRLHEALRGALQGLKCPPATISYLASVLEELSAEELADPATVQTLLEPFLFDALKSGRERVHDNRSDARVEKICRDLCSRLTALATPVPSPAASPAPPDTTLVAATTAALRRALAHAFGPDALVLPAADESSLAAALAALQDDLAGEAAALSPEQLADLVQPFVLGAFHEKGDWPSSEDASRLLLLGESLSAELPSLRAERSRAREGATEELS